MGVTNLGYPPQAPTAGYNPAYAPATGHGPDIYRAPSPYRGTPAGHSEQAQAILSRSRAPSPNPMMPQGGGIYGQRAPSPLPGGPYGNRSRNPSPNPGGVSGPIYPPRAASPLPGVPPPPYGQSGLQYPGAMPPRSPHVGGGAVLGGVEQPPPMLPPPDGFSRPANLAQSYTFFDTMKIQDMDDFYENMPRMPKVLVPHDVYHEDWIRFIQVKFPRSFSAKKEYLSGIGVIDKTVFEGPRALVGRQTAHHRPEPRIATFARGRRPDRTLEQLVLRPTRRRGRPLQRPRATLRPMDRPGRAQPPRLRRRLGFGLEHRLL